MRVWLADFDRLLRGGFTQPDNLRQGRIEVPATHLIQGGLVLGASYGLFMGLFGALRDGSHATWLQPMASTFKVPLLFLLTLLVTFPSLYVFSALAGSRLRCRQTLRLLLAAIGVQLALLASLGPVVGFFTLSTQSYPFMVLLNVLIFGASGICGLVFLRRALDQVFAVVQDNPKPARNTNPSIGPPMPLEMTPLRRNQPPRSNDLGGVVFRTWLGVYGIVGAQMGWILRPFIGNPDQAFSLFREREGSFFGAVLGQLGDLLR